MDMLAYLLGKAAGGGGVTVSPLPVTENGTYTAPEGQAYSPIEVNVPTSGGEITSGVKFVDYDGTVVETWDSASVASKTTLPDNPTHTGLVAQGWNWTLANIKSYVVKYPNAIALVGQMYKTSSGLTEIDITVTKVTGLTVTCKMAGNKNWGDGTTNSATSHTYTNYGNYTITCDGTSIPAGTASSGGMFGTSSSNMNRYWCSAIRIGGSVTSVGNYAFKECPSLTSITIPDSVTSIGTSTFHFCNALTSITIADGVTNIENNAFYGCYSLTSITIADGVRSIGNNAFQNCYSLTSITIADGVRSIGTNAFYNCYSLASITITDGVTSIGNSAFYNCYSLASITIADGVTNIENNAFYNCPSLTSITIPDSVTSIGNSAFYACPSLTSIAIPDGVTSIGTNVFYNCYSLVIYDFSSAMSVPSLSASNAFAGINGICKIMVPDALYDSWIVATNWSSYANYIYKASEVAA